MTRDDYLSRRRCYEPEKVRLIIIAESPPVSGKYFYDSQGAVTEPLFAALMKLLHYTPHSKQDGLEEAQRRGWVLVDATYEPVNNRNASRRERNNVIERDYERLRHDLLNLSPDRSAPVILIKANVCQILEPKLTKDRFNVLNSGFLVYFPSSGQQTKFHEQFGAILKSAAWL